MQYKKKTILEQMTKMLDFFATENIHNTALKLLL